MLTEDTMGYCSPASGGWGIIRVAALIPESYLLFVCPSACFRHGALGAIQHGYKGRVSYLYVKKEDIVNGYDDLIAEGIEELLERLPRREIRIRTLLVFVSCLDDFIGTDGEKLMELEESSHPEIAFRMCHMDPIAADTKNPPLVTTLRSMFSLIRPMEKREDAIGILGNFVSIPMDSDLGAVLTACGRTRIWQLSDCHTYEEFLALAESRDLILTAPYGKKAADLLEEKTGLCSLFLPVSYDLEEIRGAYQALLVRLVDETKAREIQSEILKKWEEDAASEIENARNAVGGLPIAISDSAALRPFSLAKALLSYGFRVQYIFAEAVPAFEQKICAELREKHPEIQMMKSSHTKFAAYRLEEKELLSVGLEGAYLTGCDYVVSLSSDEGMYGYHGVGLLMKQIREAVKQKADLSRMIEEYGGIV